MGKIARIEVKEWLPSGLQFEFPAGSTAREEAGCLVAATTYAPALRPRSFADGSEGIHMLRRAEAWAI